MTIICAGRAMKKTHRTAKPPVPTPTPVVPGAVDTAMNARFMAEYREAVEAQRHADEARTTEEASTRIAEEHSAMVARWHTKDRIMASLELHYGADAEARYLRRYGPDGDGPWSGSTAYYQTVEDEHADRLALHMSDAAARRKAREYVLTLRAEHQRARREAGLS